MKDADIASNEEANSMENALVPVVRIADTTFFAHELPDYLLLTLQLNVLKSLIKFKVLDDEISAAGIDVSEDEVMEELTAFRLERNLLTAEATQKWLNEQLLNMDNLWGVAERQAKLSKLRRTVFDAEAIDEHFALNKATLSKVECYQIIVDKEAKASELAALIKQKSSFFDLARQHSEDQETRKQCGYAGIRYLSEFESNIQFKVQTASEGDIIGPLKSQGQYYLIYIDKFYPATLDDQSREAVSNQLFQKWCANKINSTLVEWQIGNNTNGKE